MPIGYAEPRAVSPGGTIAFMVHADDAFDVAVVELLDGPAAERGAHVERALDHEVTGRYDAHRQTTPLGSFVVIDGTERLNAPDGLTFCCWLWATMPSRGRHQGIFGLGPTHERVALCLDPRGRVELGRWHDEHVDVLAVSDLCVSERCWTFVGFTLDPTRGDATVWWRSPYDGQAGPRREAGTSERKAAWSVVELAGHPLTLAATDFDDDGRSGRGRLTLNGKLEAPSLWVRRLSEDELSQLATGSEPSSFPVGLAGNWTFARDFEGPHIHDDGPLALHGSTRQAPARAVTGRRWTGEQHDPRIEPAHYGAIHFHEDDLADAAWGRTLSLAVPATWTSGIYAVRVESGGMPFHIPFVVRADQRSPARRVLFLLPTLTYLAYANSRNEVRLATATGRDGAIEALVERYATAHLGPSLYDRHADASPVYMATSRKPIVELQPDLVSWATGGPRHFSLDLGIYGWLRRSGAAPDVLIDEDLDELGAEALQGYAVLVTGCHPEYTTPRMSAALAQYIAGGGHLMYLGGNGLYWSVARTSTSPALVEIRRGQGGSGGAPDAAVGENHEAATGRLGGSWRYRGQPAHKILGVGTTAVGYAGGAPYRVTGRGPSWLASSLAEAADDAGLIGRATSGRFGGAAGDEIDRADAALGTPPQAEIVATSAGLHAHDFSFAKEDFNEVPPSMAEHPRRDDLLRADVTYYENDRGGAVFACGSVAWSLGLLHGVEDRSVHDVTSTVFAHFLE